MYFCVNLILIEFWSLSGRLENEEQTWIFPYFETYLCPHAYMMSHYRLCQTLLSFLLLSLTDSVSVPVTESLLGLQIPQASSTWQSVLETCCYSQSEGVRLLMELWQLYLGRLLSSGTLWVILDVQHFDLRMGGMTDFTDCYSDVE